MYFLFDARIDHQIRPMAIGARQLWRGPEQAANKRALRVDFAAAFTKMRATEIGQRSVVFCGGFNGKP